MLHFSNALKVIIVLFVLLACNMLYGMDVGGEKPVKHEDINQGSLRALVKRGTNQTVAIAAYKDYYPYGQLMPGRNYQTTDYRYGYQGQFAETDPETGFSHFEAREFDSRLGRWMIPDPARQHWSPYMGMGNNPVSGVDPDGARYFTNGTDCKWFSGLSDFWNANFSSTWDLTPGYDDSQLGTTTYFAEAGGWVYTDRPTEILGSALGGGGGWLDNIQTGLDVTGIADPTGIVDGVNALIYAGRGQWGNAGISALAIIPYIGDVGKASRLGAKATGLSYELIHRTLKGADGGLSRHVIERLDGDVISKTHQVFKDGKIIHQHQNHIGTYGTIRTFPEEWLLFPTIK